jgi:nucleoside-diphosphate-sugar epimerase
MVSVLVIGGSGFFGKSIADAYLRGLLAPWKIDRLILAARSASALAHTHPELLARGVEFMDLDVATIEQLPWANYVIHAAATTDARRYLLAPINEKANILATTQNFCRLAKRDLVDSRIVYTSSGAVYGVQPPDLTQLTEQYSLSQSVLGMASHKRDYAAAKRDAEAMIEELGNAGLHVSIARGFAFVGAYLPLDQHFAIGNFIANGLSQQPIVVKATSPVIRSYLYADDLVLWLMHLATRSSPKCPIWNIGSDEEVSIRQLAHKIADRFGVTVQESELQNEPIDRYLPAITLARQAGMQLDNLDLAIDKTLLRIDEIARLKNSNQ